MIEQRRKFVQQAVAAGANLSALCREFGITRKTGRLWRDRAREEGLQALSDRSRRPLHSPHRRDSLVEEPRPHWPPGGSGLNDKCSGAFVPCTRKCTGINPSLL